MKGPKPCLSFPFVPSLDKSWRERTWGKVALKKKESKDGNIIAEKWGVTSGWRIERKEEKRRNELFLWKRCVHFVPFVCFMTGYSLFHFLSLSLSSLQLLLETMAPLNFTFLYFPLLLHYLSLSNDHNRYYRETGNKLFKSGNLNTVENRERQIEKKEKKGLQLDLNTK